MFRSGFFWKLYASYAAIVLVTAAVIGLLVHGRMEQSLVRGSEDSLRDDCYQLAPYARAVLQGREPGDAGQELRKLAEETGVRVTLIAPSGAVIADSHEDPAVMVNHIGRPEVRLALRDGIGIARRFSTTVRHVALNVAHSLYDGSELIGIVRASIPLDELEGQLASMRARIALGAAIGTMVALALGLVVARRITTPIVQMTEVAEAMRRGSYDVRIRDQPRSEVGVLADALNRLGAEMTRRLAALAGEEAQLRAMLAGMVEGVVGVDHDDCVVFSNAAARKLLGIPVEPTPGRRLWELVRVAELDGLIEEARENDRAARRELTISVEGRERALRAQAHRFSASGSSGVVVVFDDITELRRLERVRSDFVANVSHELKTPLTSIRGYVETLLSGAAQEPENNLRFLKKIDDNVERLTHLVKDLLSLARIEAEGGGLSLEEVDWRSIALQAARRHENGARLKGIDLRIVAPDSTVRVLGDEESMTQVIDNLLDNAIKYTPETGSVTIVLGKDGTHGVLEVRDTGIGIPPEEQVRIFERFYRVDKARSRELGGTGLGLSIVKHLVQAMHGDVRVDSEPGSGSSFVVRLPRSA